VLVSRCTPDGAVRGIRAHSLSHMQCDLRGPVVEGAHYYVGDNADGDAYPDGDADPQLYAIENRVVTLITSWPKRLS
jgi:hypothetical protein